MTTQQQVQERPCQQCMKPMISGRRDKRFCNSACKSLFQRTNILSSSVTAALPFPSASNDIPAPTSFPSDARVVLLSVYGGDGQNKERYKLYKKLRRYQEKQDPLHGPYAAITEQFIAEEHNSRTPEEYALFAHQIRQTVQAYLQHPGLQMHDHIAHGRLYSLYIMHNYLKSGYKYVSEYLAQEVNDCGEVPDYNDLSMEIKDADREYLWQRLLGIWE
ncbi:MAG: hypothetical protein EOO61_20690 [Hymenobacter sp.]|nr:MAG: hypothetical protein EOO61_20690 [Hymenobacter sp.]